MLSYSTSLYHILKQSIAHSSAFNQFVWFSICSTWTTFLLAFGISKVDSKYQWTVLLWKQIYGKSWFAERNSNTVSKLSASATAPKFSKKHHKFKMYKILMFFPCYTLDCFLSNSPYSYLPLTVVFLFTNTHLQWAICFTFHLGRCTLLLNSDRKTFFFLTTDDTHGCTFLLLIHHLFPGIWSPIKILLYWQMHWWVNIRTAVSIPWTSHVSALN